MKKLHYPEHEKLAAIREISQAQGDFISWLEKERGICLAAYGERGDTTEFLYRTHKPLLDLLSEYHGIDQKKLEAEKLAMLEELRNPKKGKKE